MNKRNVVSYSQHMALINSGKTATQPQQLDIGNSHSNLQQEQQQISSRQNEVLVKLRTAAAAPGQLSQHSGIRDNTVPSLVNQTQATATWSSNSNLQNISDAQHHFGAAAASTAAIGASTASDQHHQDSSIQISDNNNSSVVRFQQQQQQQVPPSKQLHQTNQQMTISNQVAGHQQDGSQHLYIMPTPKQSTMTHNTITAGGTTAAAAAVTNGGFDPTQVLNNIRAAAHTQQKHLPQQHQVQQEGQSPRQAIQQLIAPNPFLAASTSTQHEQDSNSFHGEMKEAINLEVNSTGHRLQQQQRHQHDQSVVSSQQHGVPQSDATPSYSIESHYKEIEEQVVRRMRDQIQSMEVAKIQAERRCEAAQQQTMALMAQNNQLRQQCQQLDQALGQIKDENEQHVAQLEREIKFLKLQHRKSELEQAKSPVRGGGPKTISQSMAIPSDQSTLEAATLKTTLQSSSSPQQHQRPKSVVPALNLGGRGAQDQQSSTSLYSARNTTSRSRQVTPTRPGAASSRPGKLDLLKLAEIYKENPQLEKPQLVLVEFFL